ncbi:MAG: hypothetical protein HC819_07760 [Cyclobacteriaceae bacterium]|nr:hypothetical protein [Cyclobacteriaceae bacterium]
MKNLLILSALFFRLSTYAQSDGFYVALIGDDSNPGTISQPFGSIQKAIDATVGNDVKTVLLNEGVYEIKAPLVFTSQHSGLTLKNVSGEKVMISGGKKIDGWKKQRNGWWVTTISGVKSGAWTFRQLYVNDSLRQRARKPNSGFLKVKGMPEGTPKTVNYHTDCQSFEFAPGDIDPGWKNLGDAEVIVYHFWTDSHLPIESIDASTNIVTFKHKAGKVFTDDFSEEGARYVVENVLEELDAPGEWYLDRKSGKCYYYPYPDEEIETVEFYAPVAGQLMRFEGNPDQQGFIKNVNIKNIDFRFTHWELPAGNSNDRQGSASVPAAIYMEGLQQSTFEHCSFANLGNWAFDINNGCSENTFSANEIGHIAAGGFRINGGDYSDSPFLRTFDNVIVNNHIHHYGETYPSAVGVLLQKTEGNLVAHNLIHHGFYTGISIGWEWGYQRSVSRDNIIEFNHIHHIGQGLLSDMGAIYTLGVSPGTVIRNNLIHDVDANHYGGWGIYHDEGSTHILVENNVVYGTKFAAFNMHFAREVTVRNNIFAMGRLQQINRTRSEPHKSVFFEQNIVYWKEGVLFDGNWKDFSHSFYFHPKNESGTREVSQTFDADYNLYFNPDKKLEDVDFGDMDWEAWRKMGKDIHSFYADPLFEDAENGNFDLKQDSPAFRLGFKPIDMSSIGLNGKRPGPLLTD